MKTKTGTIEQQYARACQKRRTYSLLTIIMIILPVVGYVAENDWVFPREEMLYYLPINYGAYGLIGLVIASLIIALIIALISFFAVIRTDLSLLGFIRGLVVVALILGFSTGFLEILSGSFGQKIANWFSTNISSQSVPGISRTLGVAVLCSLLYDAPLIIIIWRCIVNWKKCAKLKVPAIEEKEQRELHELHVAEEKVRQKQLRKQRKEQEEKERREYERYILAQARAMKRNPDLGEYSFFDGCMTAEQIDARFEKMIQIYDAEDGSGDPALSKVIRKQYEDLKKRIKGDDSVEYRDDPLDENRESD